jgi:MFS transporter, ACS family, D-galactonate transporter
MPSPTPPITPAVKRDGNLAGRWGIAWLLGIGVLVNYFDRVNLSVSKDALVASFGISSITFGYLSGAYSWTYAMCQIPLGVILDKFGVRRIGRFSTFLWSIASFAAAASPGVPSLLGARFLLGIGEAPTFPSNAKAIGLWFPPEQRSTATALYDGAAKFATALGVPILGVMVLHIGWRWSFAVTGLLSLLYFLLFGRVYRDPEEYLSTASGIAAAAEQRAKAALVAKTNPPASLGTLLSQKKVWGLTLGIGSYNYVFYLLLAWLPSYLSMQLKLDLLHSFLWTSVPWLIATAANLGIGGWLTDALIRRGWNASRVRKTVLIAGVFCGLGILGAANTHSAATALIWISISIGGLSAASPVAWSVPALIAPRGSVGSVCAIMNFFGQLSGIAAPIITGYVVQSLHSFAWAFGVSAIYLLIGIAAYIFLLGKVEPMFPARA